jgi:hypothetical protein
MTMTIRNRIRFRGDYKISSPPPGAGTPAFEQADREANAFLAAWLAGWDKRTLKSLRKKLSPLAVEIVSWAFDEIAAAAIAPIGAHHQQKGVD